MKSGSWRAMPGPPKLITVCGTSRLITMRSPRPWMARSATGASAGLAGRSPNTRSISLPAASALEIADDADGQLLAREHAPGVGLQIVGRDGGDGLGRALRGPAIGMIGKRRRPEAAVGDFVRIGAGAAQFGEQLAADALDRLGVEARRGQREAQQGHGLVEILRERAQRAAELIARRREADLDRLLFHALLERLRGSDRRRPRRASTTPCWRRPACPPDRHWRRR